MLVKPAPFWKSASVNNDLVMEWTLPAAATIKIRGYNGQTYNYDVDWGDSTTESGVTTYSKDHAYAAAGTYQVKISGDFAGFRMDNISGSWKSYLTRIIQWGNIEFKTFYGAFGGCDGLLSIPTDSPDISNLNITGTNKMFFGCSSLTSLDLSNWTNTSNFSGSGHSMLYGLQKCTSINLTGFDTSNLTNCQDFMAHCGRTAGGCTVVAPNLDWQATDTLYRMFYRACPTSRAAGVNFNRFLYELGVFSAPSGFTTSLDMSTWNNTSGINSMQYFAYNSPGITSINITGWDTSNVTNMYRVFYGCTSLGEIIGLSTMDISSVTTAYQMFYNTRSLHFTNHNFGSSWNNWAAHTDNFNSFFYRNGYNLSAASRGPVPTVSAWSMPNATGSMANCFKEARYEAGSTLTINWNYPNVTSLSMAFYTIHGVDTLNINMTTTSALTNMHQLARVSPDLHTIVFGSNMDFSGVTTINTAFFQISSTPTTLTFDASVDFGALTDIGSLVGSGSTRKMITASYDALLVRLEATNSNTVTINVNASQYTGGSAADTARAALIADHSWTITDAGAV